MRIIEQEEMDALLVEHTKWLEDEQTGSRLELERVQIKADLSHRDLRKAVIHYCQTSKIKMRGADLSEVDFFGTSLCRGNLQEANLYRTSLIHTDLSHAQLNGADMRKCDLGQARLEYASFRHTNLEGARLVDTILSPVILTWQRKARREKEERVFYGPNWDARTNIVLEVGETYDAPVMSWDPYSGTHPGFYVYEDVGLAYNYCHPRPLVKVTVLSGDFLAIFNGGIRCAQLHVCESVDSDEAREAYDAIDFPPPFKPPSFWERIHD